MTDYDERMNWLNEGGHLLTGDELADLRQMEGEIWAEGAWLRAAEAGDEESRQDLAEFEAQFPGRYSDGPV